jgi:hypothetical protein
MSLGTEVLAVGKTVGTSDTLQPIEHHAFCALLRHRALKLLDIRGGASRATPMLIIPAGLQYDNFGVASDHTGKPRQHAVSCIPGPAGIENTNLASL